MKRIITKEKIYGNMAIVFHRTSYSNLIDTIYTEGFKSGYGDMYGKGFYSTYELESQERRDMSDKYGSIVVKFSVPVGEFFIFDWEEFKKLRLAKELNADKDSFLTKQAEHYNLNIISDFRGKRFSGNFLDDLAKKYNGISSDTAQYFINNTNIERKVRGIIFTGRRDGKVLVAYDTSIIMPLSYRVDGEEEFSKVERNKEYMKKVLKRKLSIFEPKKDIIPDWLVNAEFDKSSVYKIENDQVIWISGDWENGKWKNGTWENGNWKNGDWENGTWKNGVWENGLWYDGTWKNGTWEDGIWQDGTWRNGVWKDGDWENGDWENGNWKNGVWKNGTWKNGDWESGWWCGGKWKDGLWKNGTWLYGVWKNGTWKNGDWEKGIWENGKWAEGVWVDGLWKDGVWENGDWISGIWLNGTWENGDWGSFYYKDAPKIEWRGGIWKKGRIYDKEEGRYVKSDVNPKEYFERKKRQ